MTSSPLVQGRPTQPTDTPVGVVSWVPKITTADENISAGVDQTKMQHNSPHKTTPKKEFFVQQFSKYGVCKRGSAGNDELHKKKNQEGLET